MQLKLDKRFQKNIAGHFGRYRFQVGVLEDKSHKLPKRGVRGLKGQDVISSYAGGPVRKISSIDSGLDISDVSQAFRKHMGFNYLTRPFDKRNRDRVGFTDSFFKLVFGLGSKKRVENLLQAVVRNPILRGDYGNNSEITKKIKGFNRFGIDTAQLFKNIKAKCVVHSNV